MSPLRVVVWNEFLHERSSPVVEAIYPQGIHATIRAALERQHGASVQVTTATLEEPEHGLTAEVLAATDVLMWWGHAGHDRVADEVVARVQQRVWEGMGLVVLHSAHNSKIFKKLMGTSCMLRWREAAERERVWVIDPGHPIVAGIENEHFDLPHSEMYGEFFDVPPPDELFLLSWFEGGEVFRSGCSWKRGKGRIVYLSPGHETFPIYHDPNIQRLLGNAVFYSAPQGTTYFGQGRNIPHSLSPISGTHVVDETLHQPK
jgi:trehalose utilization protein